jgi:hypothetical protein
VRVCAYVGTEPRSPCTMCAARCAASRASFAPCASMATPTAASATPAAVSQGVFLHTVRAPHTQQRHEQLPQPLFLDGPTPPHPHPRPLLLASSSSSFIDMSSARGGCVATPAMMGVSSVRGGRARESEWWGHPSLAAFSRETWCGFRQTRQSFLFLLDPSCVHQAVFISGKKQRHPTTLFPWRLFAHTRCCCCCCIRSPSTPPAQPAAHKSCILSGILSTTMAQNTPGASDDGAASDVAALEQTTLNPNAAPWEHGYDDWAPAARATALPEVWALVAEHGDGLVATWRLMRVCKAARVGAKDWLRTLPGFVVCGGYGGGGVGALSDVWRLDLATLRWEPMPALLTGREQHACCAVRGSIVVLGGGTPSEGGSITSSVEMLSGEQGAFVSLPLLSLDNRICLAAAIAVDESDSAAGQVLLLGVTGHRAMHLVDLATGTCTRQPDMLHARFNSAAARLKDGRVVCVGGGQHPISAEVYGPPVRRKRKRKRRRRRSTVCSTHNKSQEQWQGSGYFSSAREGSAPERRGRRKAIRRGKRRRRGAMRRSRGRRRRRWLKTGPSSAPPPSPRCGPSSPRTATGSSTRGG